MLKEKSKQESGIAYILIIVLLALLVLAALILVKFPFNIISFKDGLVFGPKETEITETKYKIAVTSGASANEAGDILIMNSDGSGKRKLTNISNVDTLHGWSPDNEYIAVTFWSDGKEEKKGWWFGVINTKSGEVKKLKDKTYGPTLYDAFWYSDKELIYFADEKIEKINITNGTISDLPLPPGNISIGMHTGYHPFLSPNKKWVALEKDSLVTEPNLYSYNLDNGELYITLPFNQGWFLGWRDDKVVYSDIGKDQPISIWEVNPDGSNRTKIVEVGENRIIYQISSTADGGRIFFQEPFLGQTDISKLFMYDYLSKTKTELNIDTVVAEHGKIAQTSEGGFKTLLGPGAAKDGSYITLGVSASATYSLNTKTGEIIPNYATIIVIPHGQIKPIRYLFTGWGTSYFLANLGSRG